MKTTLRAKLLQHLVSKKKANEGFTLIELLVVIIIIGILAAIALPSFLNQANRARQTEAVTNVGAINRGQQAYVLEETFFSDNIAGLGIGIKVESDNYAFGDIADIVAGSANVGLIGFVDGAGINDRTADPNDYRTGAAVFASPFSDVNLKAYVGSTYLLTESTTGETTSTTILCEEIKADDNQIADIDFDVNAGLVEDAECGAGSDEV
ncbi:type IV pilin-like G/H family protein [Adonisia turfae]|uniref:Prepilin-type N-terminal cleavage/methylation domain-containing protein n=1 Tax=Adonisia turfae CCMR0081 TaxID=2292702 RepID=A0A6M0RVW4_9CYAN|nr:type IV pilin-like G/H family protein [Adonisia turfae]NEZ60309.1 prepilin-type N-terminal cleavage/methylation domain-containing protein [Adonisia turfae CCMR0081]